MNADDSGQCGFQRLLALIGLAQSGDLAALDREIPHVGQLGHAEVLGDDRRHGAAGAVGGLVAGDHQIGRRFDLSNRMREHPGGLHHVRAGDPVVEHVYGLVSAHRQRLADRLAGPLGPQRQDDDLAGPALGFFLLLDQQRRFDGAFVDLVQDGIGGVAIEGEVTVAELALRPCVRDLLDQNHDVGHG